jgi:MFS family permease
VRLTETHGPRAALDLPGLALVSGAAISLVWALVRSGSIGWGRPETLATLAAGALLLAGFVGWERRAPEPMLPPRLFASRTFAAANATAFLMSAAIMAAAFLVAQYFQFGLGYGPLGTGLRLLPWTATPILIAPIAGTLSDRIGPRPIMTAGMLLQAAGLAWFALLATVSADYRTLVPPLVLAGVGISMAIPTTPAAALSAVAAGDIGKASGTNSTLQRFGGAFGIAIASAVFSSAGHLGSSAGFDAGFRPALVAAAVISLAGAGAAICVRARRRTREIVAPVPGYVRAG